MMELMRLATPLQGELFFLLLLMMLSQWWIHLPTLILMKNQNADMGLK